MPKRITPRPEGVPVDLGAPQLPGSKSHAQRAMLLASCLVGRCEFTGVPANDDLAVLLKALTVRGVRVTGTGRGHWVVEGSLPAGRSGLRIDAGENATCARILLSMLPLLGCDVTLDGHPRLRRRPMGAVTAMLRNAGVVCDRDQLPIHADGRGFVDTRLVQVDASVTTQPASGAMLAVALGGGGIVEVAGPAAGGYLDLTAQVLGSFGGQVVRQDEDWGRVYELSPPGGGNRKWAVPPDPSARAFVAVLAALHGHELPRAFAAPSGDAHPDWQIDGDIAVLRDRELDRDDMVLAGMEARPDCVPALAMLAAQRSGRTRFLGVRNLRTKESDRLGAIAAGLGALGVETRVGRDDLTVKGPISPSASIVTVPPVADHRIVMALALLGTLLPGGIEVQNPKAVGKSWPDYWDWLGRCAVVE